MSNGMRETARTHAPGASALSAHDKILGTVIDLLGAEGYDGVQLREVARRAHVSLARIYGIFGSRDRLIVAAMLRWMDAHAYAALEPPSQLGRYEGLMHVFRAVFEPWERSPRMLEAFHRARTGSTGQSLVHQGAAAIGPAIRAALDGADPAYVRDVELLLANIFYALFGRFADGELAITDLLPILERTAFRLTADNTTP
jgi:TetR/AcrR family transcriptional regulator, cholesterol catabolism regulator